MLLLLLPLLLTDYDYNEDADRCWVLKLIICVDDVDRQDNAGCLFFSLKNFVTNYKIVVLKPLAFNYSI